MIKKFSGFILFLFLLISFKLFAQVGIGTGTPNGALDVNSSSLGFVYPVVQLSGLNIQTIVNPNATNLVVGTTVYNTTTVNSGTNSVYPGIYFWDGSVWIPQFNKNDYQRFEQEYDLDPASNYGDEIVYFVNNTFRPKYNGKYKVKLTVHYGGGEANVPQGPSQYVNFVAATGKYKFTFNGVLSTFDVKSYSANNYDTDLNGGATKNYVNQFRQTSLTREETLNANTNYTFSLTFNQEDLPGIVNLGTYGSPNFDIRALGYIFIDEILKCTVEISYVGN